MVSASLPLPDRRPARLAGRTVALLLVIAVHLLLIAVLLLLAPPGPPPRDAEPTVVRMIPLPKPPSPVTKVARIRKAGGAASKSPVKATRKPAPAQPMPDPGSRPFATELMDAVDIAALPNRKGDPSATATADGSGAGSDSGSAYGPGAGPGGERLFDVEWVREPTHAELGTYLPRSVPMASWAEIACRTIEKNRVDDCRELGDSQPGSGLARAIRQAAWQFQIRPPRLGGRAIIGAWVRIRIDFTETGEKTGRG